jgi:uncharacterized repeat protein (TIGR01451 family)
VNKNDIACTADGAGAQCPLVLTVAQLEGAGLVVPALPVGTTLTFTVTASITALNGVVTNTAIVELPAGMTDSDTGNNAAQDLDNVRGLVNLSISKSNSATTVQSGGTTTYVIVVGNGGPSDAANAVVADPAAPGLSCIQPVVCSASGGASCGGPNPVNLPVGSVQSGFAIPSLPAGGQIVLSLTCNVSALGS